jgi:hypothetical protein
MNINLAVRLRGPLPDAQLARLHELLSLESNGRTVVSSGDEVARRFLDDFHTVALILRRHGDDGWELLVTSLALPPSERTLEQCRADIRAAVADLGLAVEASDEPAPDASAAQDVDDMEDVDDTVDDERPAGVRPRVPAPPPGAGPVSLEQAEAIAAEWINAGRPADGQVGAGVYEFELGYIVYPVGAPETEVGTARGVINKRTGELSVWPSLSLKMVADMYREMASGGLHEA